MSSSAVTAQNPEANIDAYTGKEREPNTLYSNITDEQLKNMHKNEGTFFQGTPLASEDPNLRQRFYVDRFTHTMNGRALVSGRGAEHVHGFYNFVNDMIQPKEIPPQYNRSLYGSSSKWGATERTGENTAEHLIGERRERYTTIDTTRRNPTCVPASINMRYGRPQRGYYDEKHPTENTWFNADVKLERTNILPNLRPKTSEEYELINKVVVDQLKEVDDVWPGLSEYSAKMGAKERTGSQKSETVHGREFYEVLRKQRAEEENKLNDKLQDYTIVE